MIKDMKRVLCFVLTLAMCLSLAVSPALAAEKTRVGVTEQPAGFDTGIEKITNISLDMAAGKMMLAGTLKTEYGVVAAVVAKMGENNNITSQFASPGNFPVDGTDFVMPITMPKTLEDGFYCVALGDTDNTGVSKGEMVKQGYRVVFRIENETVVGDPWNTILKPMSKEFTVGKITPETPSAAAGTDVTLSVSEIKTTDGTDLQAALPADAALTYQWQFKGAEDSTFKDITGAEGMQLPLTAVDKADEGSYQCAVTYTEKDKDPRTELSPAAALTVTKGNPTITIVSSAVTLTYSGIGLNVPEGTATTNASRLSYLYEAADATASLEEGLPLTAGTYNVTAVSEEDDDYSLATASGIVLTVNPAEQKLTTENGTTSIGSTLNLTTCVEGAKGKPVFRVDSNSIGAVLNADGKTLEGFTAAGAVTVFVKADAVPGQYAASDEESFIVTVNEGKAVNVGTVEGLSGGTYKAGGIRLGDIAIAPAPAVTAAEGGAAVAGTWSWAAPETTLGAIREASQEAVFTPNAASNGGIVYAGVTAQIPVTITKATPELTLTLTPTAAAVGKTAAAVAVLSCDGDTEKTVTYSSEDETIATVGADDGVVTPVTKGAVTIIASFAGDDNYEAVTKGAVFTVQSAPDAPELTLTAGNAKISAKWNAEANGSEIEYYIIKLTRPTKEESVGATIYGYNDGDDKTMTVTDSAVGDYIFTSPDGIEWITPDAIGASSYPVTATTKTSIVVTPAGIEVVKEITTSALSNTFDGLTNNVTYTVTAQAKNALGLSPETSKDATPKSSSGGGGGGGGGGSSSVTTPTYTVEFKAGSHGTLSGDASVSVEKDAKITKTPQVKPEEGYRFLGWSADGKTIVDLSAYKVTGKVTLTALYQKGTGYIEGYTDGTFRPDANMTRAEVATVLSKLSKTFDSDKTYNGSFSDVGSDWFAKYVNFAAGSSIFSGYSDGSFRPDSRITRAEFAACLANFMGIKPEGNAGFTDTANHWADGYIAALKTKNIVSGYEDNTFKPENSITRAEVVTMLNLALGIKLDSAEGAFVPSDVAQSHWAYDQIVNAVNADIEAIQK